MTTQIMKKCLCQKSSKTFFQTGYTDTWRNGPFFIESDGKIVTTDLFTLLERQLVLAPGLEVVKGHKELRVPVLVLAANKKILARGPAET